MTPIYYSLHHYEVLATVILFFCSERGGFLYKATYSSISWDIQFKRNIKIKLKHVSNVDPSELCATRISAGLF